jgi:lysophospholipid acyltransferase (LPLAT)-like uncharacterized protein
MEEQQDYSLKDRLMILIIPTIVFLSFKILTATWTVTIIGQEKVDKIWADGKRVCYAAWHGRFLPVIYTHRKQNVSLMISWHRDGELLARVVHKLGFTTVRGSTSVGGPRALVGMVKAAKEVDLGLTPDGPKGPNRIVQPGVTYISQRAEIPIVPLGISANSFWRFKSWDGFTIPKPFSKVLMLLGEPMWVKQESSGNGLEKANLELQKNLNHWTEKADNYFIRK